MVFLWYILTLILIINHSTTERLCIDSCSFDHDFNAPLIIPSNCTLTPRNQCAVILTFKYTTRIVNINFNSLFSKPQYNDIVYTTEIISHTTISLDNDSSVQNIVEYYCSTRDLCDYDYVANQALPLYINKICQNFQTNLILLLHSNPSSSSRSCLLDNGTISICNQSCEFVFLNPNQTLHACYNQTNLQFETTVGRTTPTNKPEYNYRLYAYDCTTELCNGVAKQQEIEQLIKSDHEECLISLK